MQVRTDTIAAISTPPGRGAIAVVRMSGARAVDVARPWCSRWPARPREATLVRLAHPVDARVIDDALLTVFEAPRSYTGEAMIEVACHGGLATSSAVLEAFLAAGARLAEPGEFTRRAVLNGKMDLLQAEGVLELIEARTTAHRELALAHVHGGLSRRIAQLRHALLHLEALLAYDVDFPDEDDGPVARERVTEAAKRVAAQLDRLAATAPVAEVARDGALVVIAGAPNAGKSSLFNALLGEERAIVTEIPGTTRDAVEARLERSPWPLRLVDTAGLRPTSDRLERLGIEVSERHIRAAHVVLACGETPEAVLATSAAVRGMGTGTIVGVRTKCDVQPASLGADAVHVSAHERTGLDQLLARVDGVVSDVLGVMPLDGAVLTRARQQRAIAAASQEIAQFLAVWEANALPATVAAVHIRAATHELDELVGRVEVDDVLDELFRSFCVGK